MRNLLQVEGVVVGRQGAPLLSGLTFSLAEGAALILQGPNGAGKTTLLRTLAGFLPPIGGTVTSDEPAFAGHLDGVKAQLSVRENLAFWAEIHGTSHLEAALTQFDLLALQDRPARALSAGQKRRLGLARLMLTGRKLWLLDEPTVSLDRRSVARFAEVIDAHLQQGGAALIATHTDLGIKAPILDVTPYRAVRPAAPLGAVRPNAPKGEDPFGAGW